MSFGQSLSLVTLPVADVARSRAFYERLGWAASSDSQPGVAFFDCGGTVLSLYGREDLVRDCGRPITAPGGMTLALNVADAEAVAQAVDAFAAAGGAVVGEPRMAPWGGTFAFVADPDGHLWEIAHNPFWPLDAAGRVTLPPPAGV